MTKIAIVDDSQELLDKVKCLVKSYMGTAGRLFRVWCCTNPAALVSSILDGDRFDIYILDVEMQVNTLDHYLEQLKLSTAQAAETAKSRRRIYRYLGALGGAALVILIF